jgi:dUTPase
MPTMITGAKLREAVVDSTFIHGGDPACAEGVKYDFRMSSKILKASFGRPVDANQLSASERATLFIEPGEMVFILTEERLTLPPNMFAELSPKRKLSHAGVLAIGGFCVDPRYPGRLLIGLFNLSSTRFPLLPGKKVIAATFYELNGDELSDFPMPESVVDDFPDELVVVMQKYSPLAVQSVQETVEKLRAEDPTANGITALSNHWSTTTSRLASCFRGYLMRRLRGRLEKIN